MILGRGVPATAGRGDLRLVRRDEGAMGQRSVADGKALVFSAGPRLYESQRVRRTEWCGGFGNTRQLRGCCRSPNRAVGKVLGGSASWRLGVKSHAEPRAAEGCRSPRRKALTDDARTARSVLDMALSAGTNGAGVVPTRSGRGRGDGVRNFQPRCPFASAAACGQAAFRGKRR